MASLVVFSVVANWFFGISFVVLGLCIGYHFLTRKYLNPYKLVMVFGKKGCGKSTTICKLAIKYHKLGWNIFVSEKISLPYAHQIIPSKIFTYNFPAKSVILIDEVGMLWDNRDFKNFDKKVRDWFKLQRHHKCKVYLFSQSFDIDKKLRDLTDEMYLLVNRFRVFSWGKKINKKIVLTLAESDRPSTIAENLQFDPLIFAPFGSRFFTYIPKYHKYFDSFAKTVSHQEGKQH